MKVKKKESLQLHDILCSLNHFCIFFVIITLFMMCLMLFSVELCYTLNKFWSCIFMDHNTENIVCLFITNYYNYYTTSTSLYYSTVVQQQYKQYTYIVHIHIQCVYVYMYIYSLYFPILVYMFKKYKMIIPRWKLLQKIILISINR